MKKKTQKSEEKPVVASAAPVGKVVGPGVVKRPKPAPDAPPEDAPGTPKYAPSEQVFRRKK